MGGHVFAANIEYDDPVQSRSDALTPGPFLSVTVTDKE